MQWFTPKQKAKASAAAARRGARFLDKVRKGWFWDIRVTTLDLSSTCQCILGQLHGDYEDGVEKRLGPGDTYLEEQKYGFITGLNGALDYPLLTQAWANEVRKRRGFKVLDLTDPMTGNVLVKVAA